MNSVRDIARGVRKRIRLFFAKARFRVSGTPETGLLTIVVTVRNGEQHIAQCVESLMRQEYRNVQILVVDDGNMRVSDELTRQLARLDARIEMVPHRNAAVSSARNTGVRHARGEYLAFLDSDSFVEPAGYQLAVETLERSGSDFAVMPVRQKGDGKVVPTPAHMREAHAQEHVGVTVKEYPQIMLNTVLTSRVFRRDFFRAAKLNFEHGSLYEDQMFSMEAYAAATTIDVLQVMTVNSRVRADGSSIVQPTVSVHDLHDFAYAVRVSCRKLKGVNAHLVNDEHVVGLFNVKYLDLLPKISDMDEQEWGHFVDTTRVLAEQMSEEMWGRVEARIKVLIELALRQRRDLAEAFLAAGGWNHERFPGVLAGDRLVAEFPLEQEIRHLVPARVFEFSPAETAAKCVLRNCEYSEGQAQFHIMASIEHLRVEEPQTLTACLVSVDGSRRVDVDITRQRDEAGVAGVARAYSDMSEAGALVRVPFESCDAVGQYQLEVTITAGELSRTGRVIIDSDTTLPVAVTLPDTAQSERVLSVEGAQMAPFLMCVREAKLTITSVKYFADSLSFCGRSSQGSSPLELLLCTSAKPDATVMTRAKITFESEGTSWVARMPAPEPFQRWGAGPHAYTVVAVQASANRVPVWLSPDASVELGERWQVASPLPRRGTSGMRIEVTDLAGCVLVTDITIEAECLLLTLARSSVAHQLSQAWIEQADGFRQEAEILCENNDVVRVRVSFEVDRWGLGGVALASGWYRLKGQDQAGTVIESCLSAQLLRRFPVRGYAKKLRVTLLRGSKNQAMVALSAPRKAEQWSLAGRQRLRDWAHTLTPSPDRPLVLFRNRWGEHANDSALAVYDELRRRGANFELVWSLKDYTQYAPEGARIVLEETPEFYEAFGTAHFLMVNVVHPAWHVQTGCQKIIQTHHGYPFKLAGLSMWKKLGYSTSRIDELLTRMSATDYLVSPAAYATPLLAEFYRDRNITSTVLEIGYPRNDALLDEQAAQLRENTRRRLGISDDTRVVLYAPTYRDSGLPDQFSADMVQHVDPVALSAKLGDDYLVLLRGHAFNKGATTGGAGVVDVTEHPNINHLILASDLAILDYSSLRFDYALTGKPALFFVPDEREYFATRNGFLPFRDTVYGPLITDTDELLSQIRGAQQWGRTWEDKRVAFIEKYMELEDGRAASRLVDAVFFSQHNDEVKSGSC